MFIDELKLRTELAQVSWKRKLAKKLINIVSKLDNQVFLSSSIDSKYSLNLRRYVPQDGEWHHFAHTVDCWIRFNEEIKNEKIYVDGVKAKRRK